jgi:hypothetical protein
VEKFWYSHFCNLNIIDLLSDDDDALLMGAVQPIFALRAALAPSIILHHRLPQ